jgi:alkaline phosphatase
VILFLGDAAGLPTLNAASIHAYGEPTRLYVHTICPTSGFPRRPRLPIGITDSAAGMTAIVTGQKI